MKQIDPIFLRITLVMAGVALLAITLFTTDSNVREKLLLAGAFCLGKATQRPGDVDVKQLQSLMPPPRAPRDP
jgi:Asp-tRNA(Asn)/Glu-tRNA(Gln) amidotransferase A subunit family amidase